MATPMSRSSRCSPTRRRRASSCRFWVAHVRGAAGDDAEASRPPVDLVAGPTTGGIILAFETARQLGTLGIFAEEVRDADGGTQREFRRGFSILPGERVLLVDDILTTGGSLLAMIPAVEALGGEIVECVVLVDRSGGRETLTSPTTGRTYPLAGAMAARPADVRARRGDLSAAARRAIPLKVPGSTGTARRPPPLTRGSPDSHPLRGVADRHRGRDGHRRPAAVGPVRARSPAGHRVDDRRRRPGRRVGRARQRPRLRPAPARWRACRVQSPRAPEREPVPAGPSRRASGDGGCRSGCGSGSMATSGLRSGWRTRRPDPSAARNGRPEGATRRRPSPCRAPRR